MKYIFRHVVNKEEVQACYDMAMLRMKWMDTVGIKQWNVTRYDLRYPITYYMSISNDLFVLEDEEGQIVCVAALFESDSRWPKDDVAAFYVHHFASDPSREGVGTVFLEQVEMYAASMGKEYVRLDSAVDNPKLEDYYTVRGYEACGTCDDGAYHGILRQKKLSEINED